MNRKDYNPPCHIVNIKPTKNKIIIHYSKDKFCTIAICGMSTFHIEISKTKFIKLDNACKNCLKKLKKEKCHGKNL
jgi:hypothetical protein